MLEKKCWKKNVGKKFWEKSFKNKNLRKKLKESNFGKKNLKKKFWKKSLRKKFKEINFGKAKCWKINYKSKIFIIKMYSNIDKSHKHWKKKKKILSGGESNPELPRDRRVYYHYTTEEVVEDGRISLRCGEQSRDYSRFLGSSMSGGTRIGSQHVDRTMKNTNYTRWRGHGWRKEHGQDGKERLESGKRLKPCWIRSGVKSEDPYGKGRRTGPGVEVCG